MGMLGSNGGLVGNRRVPSFGATAGVWSPNEQVLARRAGLWPTIAAARYWRMDTFASTTLNADTLDLAEIRFWDNGTLVSSGITVTTNMTVAIGSVGNLVTGNWNDGADRFAIQNWASQRPTGRFDFDFGQVRLISHIQIYGLFTQPRFPASFVLSSSAINGSGYSQVATVTVGTSFTSLGGNVWTSGQVALN